MNSAFIDYSNCNKDTNEYIPAFGLDEGISSFSEFPSARIKINDLYLEWLGIDATKRIIDLIIVDITSINLDENCTGDEQVEIGGRKSEILSIPERYQRNSIERSNTFQPPRSPTKKSPKKRTQSEMQNSNIAGVISDHLKSQSEKPLITDIDAECMTISRRPRSNFDSIPIFFFTGQGTRTMSRKIKEDELSNRMTEIEGFFKSYPGGIPVEKFVHITKRLCGVPSFFNLPLCRRLHHLYGNVNDDLGSSLNSTSSSIKSTRSMGQSQNLSSTSSSSTGTGIKIKLKSFLQFWKNEIEPYDRFERFFRIVKQTDVNYMTKDDFVPFLQELLHFHPGLDFLESHEEFQRKYALTVISRIFYKVNVSRSGKISLRELRNSNLVDEFMHVDEETDINRVTEYFSYEHFYVLYCRFFELDSDKDTKLGRDDILKYGEHSLSEAIVDRVFQVGVRAFTDSCEPGAPFRQTGMTYADFVYFMLAEEDKASVASLTYWFVCCDLDGDGKLTTEEMRYFYRAQLYRVTSLGQESVKFPDVLCQMVDMIAPQDPCAITLKDLCRPNKIPLSGVLFDVLFNLHKFIRFETRDPFQEKLRREDAYGSDWNRFACAEYHRLAAEEEGYESSAGTMDVEEEDMKTSSGSGSGGSSARGGNEKTAEGSGGGHWFLDDEDEEDNSPAAFKGGSGSGTAAESATGGTGNHRSSRR